MKPHKYITFAIDNCHDCIKKTDRPPYCPIQTALYRAYVSQNRKLDPEVQNQISDDGHCKGKQK